MNLCAIHQFDKGFCLNCLWPKENGGAIETARDALSLVDELRDTRGLSEGDAVRRVHAVICNPVTHAGKAGKEGFADA